MILEIAEIHIHPDQNAAFEAAMDEGLRLAHRQVPGMRGYRVQRSIENPQRYFLQVAWDSVEAHMVTYRESALAPAFREKVRPFFAKPSEFQHFDQVLSYGALPD